VHVATGAGEKEVFGRAVRKRPTADPRARRRRCWSEDAMVYERDEPSSATRGIPNGSNGSRCIRRTDEPMNRRMEEALAPTGPAGDDRALVGDASDPATPFAVSALEAGKGEKEDSCPARPGGAAVLVLVGNES
jgi:hypothetical protein